MREGRSKHTTLTRGTLLQMQVNDKDAVGDNTAKLKEGSVEARAKAGLTFSRGPESSPGQNQTPPERQKKPNCAKKTSKHERNKTEWEHNTCHQAIKIKEVQLMPHGR